MWVIFYQLHQSSKLHALRHSATIILQIHFTRRRCIMFDFIGEGAALFLLSSWSQL